MKNLIGNTDSHFIGEKHTFLSVLPFSHQKTGHNLSKWSIKIWETFPAKNKWTQVMINIIGLTSIYIQLPIIKTIRKKNNKQPIEKTKMNKIDNESQ